MHFDVIVAGMGIHGLMTTYLLSRRGLKVLGLDRHIVPHGFGSSHGQTRVHRRAYFEAPFYVPLLKRADELWEELGQSLFGSGQAGHPLLSRTGVLVVGRDDGRLATGALASAEQHRIHVKVLSAAEAGQLWPGLSIPSDHIAILEPLGGVLQVESLMQRLWEESLNLGALCISYVDVLGWEERDGSVRLSVDGLEDDYVASQLVLSTGPWLQTLAKQPLPLTTERQYQVLFSVPADAGYGVDQFPAIAIDRGADPMMYGIPDFGKGLKLAFHHGGALRVPDGHPPVSEIEVDLLYDVAREWLPALRREPSDSWTCTYTNTPDEHFIIDRHPESERVLLLSCCSGHGYKFGPVVGEIATQLIADGGTVHDICNFSLGRFSQA